MYDKLTPEQKRYFETIYNYLHVEDSLPKSADAIIVGGSGSRIDIADRAAELYKQGTAPVIIFSGFSNPDYGVNESKLLAKRAIDLGVPESVIIREPRATNTGLNILLSLEKLSEAGIIAEDVILIHKPSMTRRFKATAEKQWPNPKPKFFVTSVNYSFDNYLNLEAGRGLADKTLSLILSDYRANIEYPHRGFMVKSPFNAKADRAYYKLMSAGFLPHIPNDSLSSDNIKTR